MSTQAQFRIICDLCEEGSLWWRTESITREATQAMGWKFTEEQGDVCPACQEGGEI